MKNWQLEVVRWTHYGMEMMLLYLFLFPIYSTEGRLPPVPPFLTLVIIGAISFYFFASKFSVRWALLGIPVVVYIGILVGFHILLASFLIVVIFWRVIANLENGDRSHEITIFFFTLGLGLAFYFWLHSFDGGYMLIVIIFLQFFLTLILKALSMALQSPLNGKQKRTQLKWFMGSILSLGAVSLLIGLAYPFIKGLFLLGLQGLAYLANFIAAPILIFFDSLNLSLPSEEGMIAEVDTTKKIVEREFSQTNSLFDSTYTGYIALVIFLLIFSFFVYKRIVNYQHEKNTETIVESSSDTVKQDSALFNLRKFFTPKDEVRRLFYNLETKLAKLGLGRGRNETVEEWFSTLPVEDSTKNIITKTYEKVRYGNVQVNKEERSLYRKSVKLIQKQIKDIEKRKALELDK